ncbi:hypothetical protein Hypma_010493 [Hypsizygus marmoreus]|uniref:BTB domain-containing protein n=1 Tax=Hypsizygus marmoreus TaxID=39966 RepID=A0A369JSI6_HYPMA|nr:hypothetical protein Hypma_010493 [Hypsizygus marmoreus]
MTTKDWVTSQAGNTEFDSAFLTDPFELLDVPLKALQPNSTTLTIEGPPVGSISPVFNLGVHPAGSNLIFASSDSVFFYVHTDVVLQQSPSAFQSLLLGLLVHEPPKTIVKIPEPSNVLDIILRVLYGIPGGDNPPLFDTFVAAIDKMPVYGINPKDHIVPSSPSYTYLLAFASRFPLELYALAAHYEIHDLAVSTSSYLLSHSLASIDDETAQRIGPIYLKRLLCLHISRFDALKRILLDPPHPHPPTKECDFTQQKALARAWTLVSAYLACDARPDLSSSSIELAFNSLYEQTTCSLCLETLTTRLQDVTTRWACVNRTI